MDGEEVLSGYFEPTVWARIQHTALVLATHLIPVTSAMAGALPGRSGVDSCG